ncbi:hypothetical protein RUND412_006322 [Rhizina undulata]
MALFCVPAFILSLVLRYTIETNTEQGKTLYTESELGTLIELHARQKDRGGTLSMDAVRVMQGALELEHKTVQEIMRPLSEVKMLPIDTSLNLDRWIEYSEWNYTRVPVYDCGPTDEDEQCFANADFGNIRIVGFIHAADLIFVNLDNIVTLKGLALNNMPVVTGGFPVWDLMHVFQDGVSNMAIVVSDTTQALESLNCDNSAMHEDVMPGKKAYSWFIRILRKMKAVRKRPVPTTPLMPIRSPIYWTGDDEYLTANLKPIGIITMEDILKSLIGVELLDEKDVSQGRMRSAPGSTDGSRSSLESCETCAEYIAKKRKSIHCKGKGKKTAFSAESLGQTETGIYMENITPLGSKEAPIPLTPASESGSKRRRRVVFSEAGVDFAPINGVKNRKRPLSDGFSTGVRKEDEAATLGNLALSGGMNVVIDDNEESSSADSKFSGGNNEAGLK